MVKRVLRVLGCALSAVYLFGCAAVLPVKTGGGGTEEISGSSSVFHQYASECGDGFCKVQGSVRLHITDAAVASFTVQEDTEINVQGSVRNTSGDVQLIYEAPDGSRTVIADGENRKIDETVAAVQGEGGIYFTGEGGCRFKLEITAGDGVVFGGGMDADTLEAAERSERTEKFLSPEEDLEWSEEQAPGEDLERLDEQASGEGLERLEERAPGEGLERSEDGATDLSRLPELGFPGVTDNWPESIVVEDRGMTASPLYVTLKAEKAMSVSVTCTTTGGDLHVKLIKSDTKKVYLDEKDPAGDYEVLLDEAGTYCLAVYARDHKGSIRVEPVGE